MKTKRLRQLFGNQILDIELDKDQVFKDDPGQGTPAMVYLKRASGKVILDSGTYWCAIGAGELSDKGTKLTEEQVTWLQSLEEVVNDFLYKKD